LKLTRLGGGMLAVWISFILIFGRTAPADSLEWRLEEGDELNWRIEKTPAWQIVPTESIFSFLPISTMIQEGNILTIQILSLNIGSYSQWQANYSYKVGNQTGYEGISSSGLSWEIIFPVLARSIYESEVSSINANFNYLEANLIENIFEMSYENQFESTKIIARYNIAKGYQTYYYEERNEDILEYTSVEKPASLLDSWLLIVLGLGAALSLGIITGVLFQPLLDKPKVKTSR
jgi:hypothetical protein